MGEKLKINKFTAMVNPFGVIFNPVSVSELLNYTINEEPLPENMLVELEGLWYHYGLHSKIAENSKEQLIDRISKIQSEVAGFIRKTDHLIITLGTAFVYQLKETEAVVANCHKLPGTLFSRTLLSVEQITQSITDLYNNLIRLKPNIRFILTVSPVRHIKDGISMNAVSKALLRVACQQLIERHSQIDYFPGYEFMMDDLRDYRFYKKDMIHPSEVAEEYIWKKFTATYFDEPAQKFIAEWEKISKAIAHQPFNQASEAHQRFLKNTLHKLQAFRQQVDVEEEIKGLEISLNKLN
jgi:hypothetical protein